MNEDNAVNGVNRVSEANRVNKKENRRRINELFMDGIKVLIQKEKSDTENPEPNIVKEVIK